MHGSVQKNVLKHKQIISSTIYKMNQTVIKSNVS